MATLRSAIALYDGVTGPLKSMNTAMNVLLNSFESMQRTSSTAVDVRSIQYARTELARSAAALDNIENHIMENDAAQRRFNSSMRDGGSAADGLLNKVKGIAGAIGAGFGLQKITELADNMALGKARLNLIVDDGGSVDVLQRKIMNMANNVGAKYGDITSSISKLGLTAGKAFDNNDEIIRFTELMNKSFAISGASTQEQAAGMYQLTQAMASGRLQGDEYRSIIENAPLLAGAIEDYMRNVQHATGSMKDWASEGLLTADVIKAALFTSADEVDARFSELPMTFSRMWNNVTNTLLVTFQPLIEFIGRGAAFISNHWSVLEPMFYGLAAGVLFFAGATWIATGAAKTFFVTLLTNPLFWIAMAIGIVIAAIYKWVQAVGGMKVAWLIVTNAIFTGWDYVKLAFTTGVFFITNQVEKLLVFFMTFKTRFLNAVGDIKADGLLMLQDFVNGAIDLINQFIGLLNKIPGVGIDLVGQVSFGADAALRNEAAKQDRNNELANFKVKVDGNSAARAAELNQMKADALAAKERREAQIAAAKEDAANKGKDIGIGDLGGVGGGLGGIYDNTGSTAENTAKMADTLDMSKEELKYLREIAERQAINQFTTAEIKLDMTNYNSLASDVDLDGMINVLTEKAEEALIEVSEGVHI